MYKVQKYHNAGPDKKSLRIPKRKSGEKDKCVLEV